MCKRMWILMCMVVMGFSGRAVSEDYISAGRAYMFDGTISGLRLAHGAFDDAMQDSDFTNTRELLFLHSCTRTAMLLVAVGEQEVNSFQELAAQFGFEIIGDSLDPGMLDISYPKNKRNRYEVPEDAPDADAIGDLLDQWLIPELKGIIETLEMIEDSPEDRFVVYFYPSETGLDKDMQAGYGEVLILKGMLSGFKTQLTAMPAYDLTIDDLDTIIQKIYGKTFSINDDLLNPYPYFLEVLPTVNDPNLGKDSLAASAEGLIQAIDYFIDGLDYLRDLKEVPSDPQVGRFLYIGPDETEMADGIKANLVTLRDSLINDEIGLYDVETSKTYYLTDPEMNTWQLVLNYDIINQPVDSGSLEISGEQMPSSWTVTGVYDDYIDPGLMDVEFRAEGMWTYGYMEIKFNGDTDNIADASFWYWGDMHGDVHNLTGQLEHVAVEQFEFDLNPIYGSTVRYPEPVSPRDLLPEFDKWNEPMPGTVGQGLGYDPTLGGILPQMTQHEWTLICSLQPSGVFYLNELYSWQISNDLVGFWFDDQIIFDDPAGEVEIDEHGNLDIKRLYMAYLDSGLRGGIVFHDSSEWDSQRAYELALGYSMDSDNVLGSLRIRMLVNADGQTQMDIYHKKRSPYGYSYWEQVSHDGQLWATEWGMQFKLDMNYDLPGFLPGRFITLRSFSHGGWHWRLAEENRTRLQFGPLGKIHGNISFEGWQGQPIFIEAYTDWRNPDESRVSTAMITEPGSYMLEDIGLGWSGYIRAYTPVFGFDNVFELGCIELQDHAQVTLWQENLHDINLALGYPGILYPGQAVAGQLTGEIYDGNLYAFDAIEGARYSLQMDLFDTSAVNVVLYDRDATNMLEREYHWDGQEMSWLCPVGGRYFVEITGASDLSGHYTLVLDSDTAFFIADISGPDGIGIKDGKVDYYDLNVLAAYWLELCTEPDWCSGADLNKSGGVNFIDMAILASEWFNGF